MLHIYTDTKLLGMEGIVPWHVSETSLTGNAFLSLRSESEGFRAFIGIRREMWGMMRRSHVVPKETTVVIAELLQIPISFALTKSQSDKNFVIGRKMPHNEVDIFLGLLLKSSDLPPIHSGFRIARRWGGYKPGRKTMHVLSYRNAEDSYVHFTQKD